MQHALVVLPELSRYPLDLIIFSCYNNHISEGKIIIYLLSAIGMGESGKSNLIFNGQIN
jgi:hypothetical protein